MLRRIPWPLPALRPHLHLLLRPFCRVPPVMGACELKTHKTSHDSDVYSVHRDPSALLHGHARDILSVAVRGRGSERCFSKTLKISTESSL